MLMADERVNYVRVINKNPGKPVVGRFNGKDYVFKQNVPLDVPEIVAQHIFGFNLEDKMPCLNRLGWMQVSTDYESGMEKLANVVFEEPPEMIEAPKKRGRKAQAVDEDDDELDDETGSAGPPANAGGLEGEGFIRMNPSPKGPVLVKPALDDQM